MTRLPKAPPPSSPWVGRLHFALTTILFAAAAAVAGLAIDGRVQFAGASKPVAAEADDKPKGGRYQIEKVTEARNVLNCLGKTDFFDTKLADTWVFAYKGGLLEAKIETDFDGKTESPDTVPHNWKEFLLRDESQKDNPGASLNRSGYIVLSAIHNVLPFSEMHQAPLYRILVSANRDATVTDGEFTVSSIQSIRIRTSLVPRATATETAKTGGGTDLEPGKEALLLDRKRGYSQIRLKARFLGDSEVLELLPN